MRASHNDSSKYKRRNAPETEEEKARRAKRRSRIRSLNALIKAGASVTLEVGGVSGADCDDDWDAISVVSVAEDGEHKIKVYYVPFEDEEKPVTDQGLAVMTIGRYSRSFSVSI